MKILLIAYSFPPLWEAQAIRWYYLSRELAKLGFKIDVVTVKYPTSEDIELHDNIKVYKTFPGLFESASFKVREVINIDRRIDLRKKRSFTIAKKFYRFFRGFFNNLLPGDIRTEWFPIALRFIKKKLNPKNYDFLITSHEPYVDSLIGLYLKNKYPKLKWIADIADPFTAPYYPAWRKSIDRRFEGKVLDRADKILVTSEVLREDYIDKYKLNERKIILIRQGFDLDSVPTCKNKNALFTIAYTGIFYKKRRDPENLFSSLKEVDFDFQFIIAGRNEEFLPNDKILTNKIVFLGFVDHFEVLKIQKKADLLIHLTYNDSIQVPGKFYEYFGSGTPILCITYNKDDETAKLTKRLNLGFVCENNKESIKRAICKFYNIWQEDKITEYFNLNPSNLKEYSWQNCAKILAKTMLEMVKV